MVCRPGRGEHHLLFTAPAGGTLMQHCFRLLSNRHTKSSHDVWTWNRHQRLPLCSLALEVNTQRAPTTEIWIQYMWLLSVYTQNFHSDLSVNLAAGAPNPKDEMSGGSFWRATLSRASLNPAFSFSLPQPREICIPKRAKLLIMNLKRASGRQFLTRSLCSS